MKRLFFYMFPTFFLTGFISFALIGCFLGGGGNDGGDTIPDSTNVDVVDPSIALGAVLDTDIKGDFPQGIKVTKGDGTLIGYLSYVYDVANEIDSLSDIGGNRYGVALLSGYHVILDKNGVSDLNVYQKNVEDNSKDEIFIYAHGANEASLPYEEKTHLNHKMHFVIGAKPIQLAVKWYIYHDTKPYSSILKTPTWWCLDDPINGPTFDKDPQTYKQSVRTGYAISEGAVGSFSSDEITDQVEVWNGDFALEKCNLSDIFGSYANALENMSDAGAIKFVDAATEEEITRTDLDVYAKDYTWSS